MTAADRAADLRTKLFALVREFKGFALTVQNADADDLDARSEASSQADNAACELAAVHARLSGPAPTYDLFIDSARDRKARAFDFALDEAAPGWVGDTLRRLRERANLTVQELAEAAGLTRQAVHNYESGTRRPTWDAVQKLAAALGVPTDTFRDQ